MLYGPFRDFFAFYIAVWVLSLGVKGKRRIWTENDGETDSERTDRRKGRKTDEWREGQMNEETDR